MTAANDDEDAANEVRLDRLQKALDRGGNTHTLADLVEAIRDGKAMIWERKGTLAVTEVVEYPQLKAMRIWLVVGDLEECDQLLPDLEHWARAEGCSRIEAEGRHGWTVYVAALGYSPVATLFRKELT